MSWGTRWQLTHGGLSFDNLTQNSSGITHPHSVPTANLIYQSVMNYMFQTDSVGAK